MSTVNVEFGQLPEGCFGQRTRFFRVKSACQEKQASRNQFAKLDVELGAEFESSHVLSREGTLSKVKIFKRKQ